jgi:hypothetical protein
MISNYNTVMIRFLIVYLNIILVIFSQTEKLETIRVTETNLQTPVLTLSSKFYTPKIKLYGMVHLGEKSYYHKILELLEEPDFIFFEGVNLNQVSFKKDFPVKIISQTEKDKLKFLDSMDQKNILAKALKLDSQTRLIKPTKYSNWIHADIDINELMLSLYKDKTTLQSILKLPSSSEEPIYQVIHDYKQNNAEWSQEKILENRKIVAKSLLESANLFCYDPNYKVIRDIMIIQRNKKAISVLKEALKTNENLKLGIIYGVAHIPNFVEILSQDFNFEIESIEWINAWNLQK